MAREFGLFIDFKIPLANRVARTGQESTIDGWMSSQPAGSWVKYLYREDPTDDDHPFLLKAKLFLAITSRSEGATKMNQVDSNIGSLASGTVVKFDYNEQDDDFNSFG